MVRISGTRPPGTNGVSKNVIWTDQGPYRRVSYDSEADLESALTRVQDQLFGPDRIYLDVKKRIGGKGTPLNIPDGYLLDLSGQKPRLYVVENELAVHDPLRHIAVQILQFSLSFEAEPLAVKKILLGALNGLPAAKRRCEGYAFKNGFRNVDHLLERLVFETPFAALVIIDEMPENLEVVLAQKFRFGVEVLQFARYRNDAGACMYQFEPFLSDLGPDGRNRSEEKPEAQDPTDLDTVVVPARDDGFQETFLGQNRWYAVRIHGSMRPQIKYAAAYRVAPISAITHVATVKIIEPWKETGKFVLEFAGPPKEIPPIPMVKGGRVLSFQNLRYTNFNRLIAAKSLDDLW
jgi:hypothetical protein